MSYGVAQPAPAPKSRALIIPVLGAIKERIFILSPAVVVPRAGLLASLRPYFDESVEHVNVLYGGEYRDMFVGETSAINGRHIRNIRATAIYRNNTLLNVPNADPESLPAISGPAILFPDYQVWKYAE